MDEGGISDEILLKRLAVLYPENFVKAVADELSAARSEEGLVNGNEVRVKEIHKRFTPRMHDLSKFMQGLLIRFTKWFNRKHDRSGTLWEERFKSQWGQVPHCNIWLESLWIQEHFSCMPRTTRHLVCLGSGVAF